MIRAWPAQWILLASLCLPGHLSLAQGTAPTLASLRASGDFQASIVIETQNTDSTTLYQRVPFILVIEVATTGGFSRGSQVRDFRIPGAIVRPISSFADNQTRRENGRTWTVQRWRFRVYAQQPGTLTLPSVRVFASVAGPQEGPVEDEFSLAHPAVSIQAPPGNVGTDTWIAASELTLTQSWSAQPDKLQPGDAVTRTRRFEAADAPGMLLPEPDLADIPGLSLYHKPGIVRDASNRGVLRGTREDELVITAEQPGDYTLPGLEYAWFNTRSQRFETISLPAYRFSVSASGESAPASTGVTNNLFRAIANLLQTPTFSIAIVLLLLAGISWRYRRSALIAKPLQRLRQHIDNQSRRRAYRNALQHGDSVEALRLLLKHRIRYGGDARLSAAVAHSPGLQQVLRQLLEHAYGPGKALPEAAQAMALFRGVAARSPVAGESTRMARKIRSRSPSHPLTLNPPPTPKPGA